MMDFCPTRIAPPERSRHRGFTLIELIIVLVVLAILSAVALPRMMDMGPAARTASIKTLAGSVKSSLGLFTAQAMGVGLGTPGATADLTFVTMEDGTQVRLWNGYPDRWCDGIGATQQGMTTPSGGCYLSTAAVTHGSYTFYGNGNSAIPSGDAGWRIESAPTPMQCSVQYTYAGSGVPVVKTNTTGC